MSFQGDVRGIGLAELLQGLARGRKAGVLTLTAKNGFRSILGVDGGRTFLLPDPEEDAEDWRERSRDAYADDPEYRVDYLRMADIARAVRLEKLYELLDGDGAHFRFEPGPVPGRENPDSSGEDPKTHVYCDGIPIEMLLLEYARISDELQGAGDLSMLHEGVVPGILDPVGAQEAGRLARECTGRRTLKEISDRLGTPLRQARLTLIGQLRKGTMFLANPAEVLHLGLDELALSNISRAAARLRSWSLDGNGGPIAPSEAAALAREWLAGRLTPSLKILSPRIVRRILRRMDHALRDPASSVVHWEEARNLCKSDRIAQVRHLGFQFKTENALERMSVDELLLVAKEFQESGTPMRSGPLLVMAAFLQPQEIGKQLALGQGLVLAGRSEDGGPWILAAVEKLLDRDESDRALPALRALLAANPRLREARQLYSRAKRNSTQTRKLRRNILIASAGLAMVVSAAVVQVQRQGERETQLGSVRTMMTSDPAQALALLQQHFGPSQDPEVVELRDLIREQQRARELARRAAWLDTYNAASQECTQGDPVLGITMALKVPPPPTLTLLTDPWPLEADLYNGLVEGLEGRMKALGLPAEGNQAQIAGEAEIRRQLEQLTVIVTEIETQTTRTGELGAQFAKLIDQVEQRQVMRANLKTDRESQLLRDEQDRLWQQANEHSRKGDFVRAARVYEELLASDTDGKISELLSEEIDSNRARMIAVREAQELAVEGKHEESLARLISGLGDDYDPYAFMVPWDVDSFPSGASVRLVPEDRVLETPFTIQTTFGTSTELLFQVPGFDDRRVRVDKPSDQYVFLSRQPERTWQGDGRVDALPVSVESDSIVVDRRGHMARIGADDERRWTQQVQTLSGIARAPVFMPGRPGSLLVVTEEGTAWIVSGETGELEGPWDLGSPPVSGPYSTQSVVRVRLQNGTVALWKNRLKPYTPDASSGTGSSNEDSDYRFGSEAGLRILRRRHAREPRLDSPWDDWSVVVEDQVYRVTNSSKSAADYTVLRAGDWEYLAWEAPDVDSPLGRLWISDRSGLRAFIPLENGQ